jgi:hypothetical protein
VLGAVAAEQRELTAASISVGSDDIARLSPAVESFYARCGRALRVLAPRPGLYWLERHSSRP